MNGDIVNKWAMGLAVFSFGFLSIGSLLFGATVTTSVGGADTFAGLALVDNDNAGSDSETVFSVGFSLKF